MKEDLIMPTVANAKMSPSANDTLAHIRHIVANAIESDQFDDDQSFTSLGMHSMVAMNICHDMSESLGQPVSFKDLWQHHTPAQLAAYLDSRPPGV